MAATTQNKGPIDDTNGWAEYRRLVLSELERISAALDKCEDQGNSSFITLSKAISHARQSLLNRLRELGEKLEADYEKQLDELEDDFQNRIEAIKKELKKEYDKKIEELDKKDKELDKKVDKQGTDITSLKTKATVFGAIAGFIVALASLLASIFVKK